ncbi:hypothetical protein E2C01_014570 [Portunus trituberculatus]|uniref:Uncharacterized protein n=1 Tax=Portunus trituberculatus TaxID=210409 RepID=A0A5B7DJ78_PORTR|nr:hypothetical protein [Portunus trituberculatus]
MKKEFFRLSIPHLVQRGCKVAKENKLFHRSCMTNTLSTELVAFSTQETRYRPCTVYMTNSRDMYFLMLMVIEPEPSHLGEARPAWPTTTKQTRSISISHRYLHSEYDPAENVTILHDTRHGCIL